MHLMKPEEFTFTHINTITAIVCMYMYNLVVFMCRHFHNHQSCSTNALTGKSAKRNTKCQHVGKKSHSVMMYMAN